MQQFTGSIIIEETSVYKIHLWTSGKNTLPIIIIPPYAGRHGNVAQNLINRCKNYADTYVMELKSATIETKDTSITDLINIIDIIYEYAPGANLIGVCQGAWLSAIYAALYPEKVKTYTNFAGPINTKTGKENKIEKYCEITNIDIHKFVVNSHYGIQPGYMQWLSFAMIGFNYVFVQRWLELFNIIFSNDKKKLDKWIKVNGWYDEPQNLAGNWFLDCLENHFMNNKLYDGKWIVNGEIVDLFNIDCPIYLFAGTKDQITHPKQVFDMEKVVGSVKVFKYEFLNAGHTKSFTGKHELDIFENVYK